MAQGNQITVCKPPPALRELVSGTRANIPQVTEKVLNAGFPEKVQGNPTLAHIQLMETPSERNILELVSGTKTPGE